MASIVPQKTAIVFMVAGLSSRFGGRPKFFIKVGPNGESLIELSMAQAKEAGFNEIVFVVSEKTYPLFVERFGNDWKGIQLKYAFQRFDANERDKPWGSCAAVVSAKQVLSTDFVLCNGDDIYGGASLKTAHDFLLSNDVLLEGAAIGYPLEGVLPETGKVNRGIFSVDKNNYIKSIEESIGINREMLGKSYDGKDLCSMNLFALKKDFLGLLEKRLNNFKEAHKGDRTSECYLPTELSALIAENKIKLKLLSAKDKWLGVTIPEDEEIVRKQLSAQIK